MDPGPNEGLLHNGFALFVFYVFPLQNFNEITKVTSSNFWIKIYFCKKKGANLL